MPPPSRLHLPKLASPPATIFAFLVGRFPNVSALAWRERIARRLVTTEDGTVVREDTPYRHGIMVLYRREVPGEPATREAEEIVHRDDEILVADKPHGMPVTPAGDHVERSLLFRLQRSTGVEELAPMHRLDRETAGIVLFAIKRFSRRHYHRLFAERTIEREYLALARCAAVPGCTRWRIENRMASGDPWYRQTIVDGPANTITEIELLESDNGIGLFRLRPESGKKHQLRVHMASVGFPIIGDRLYPELREAVDGEPPLQLLARKLSFTDPLTREHRTFESGRRLLLQFDANPNHNDRA